MKYINFLIALCSSTLVCLFTPMWIGSWMLHKTQLVNPSAWWITWVFGFAGLVIAFIILTVIYSVANVIYRTLEGGRMGYRAALSRYQER